MENTMNILGMKNIARRHEDERIAMRREWENAKVLHRMAKVFENHAGDERETDSFELAALLACCRDGMCSFIELYKSVADFLTKPFACTIKRVPGDGEAKFGYEIHNVVEMQPVAEISYDKDAEYMDKNVTVFERYAGYYAKDEVIPIFAEKLREVYKERMSE